MSFFKEQGRDFLSGCLEEALHSFQPACGDEGFICKPPGMVVLLVKSRAPILCPRFPCVFFKSHLESYFWSHKMAPDLLDLIFDPRNIFTISTYFALEPPVMNIKI